MKSILFAIAFSSLLSLYNVEATSRTLIGQMTPAIEEICAKTRYPKECNSALVNFIAPGSIDSNAVLLAGVKALDAETAKAITEAKKLSTETPTGKAGEELMVGKAVYFVVSNCTKKALEAIPSNHISEFSKEIKLASEVTGDLLDKFQEGVGGKPDVMKDINVNIHQLAQNNFDILRLITKAVKNDQANPQKEEKPEKKEKEVEDDDDKEDEDEDEDEEEEDDDKEDKGNEEEDEEEEDSAPGPASAPVSLPKAEIPK